MRPVMFVLSLLAALTGTPLRQAEAAHDLACSLAELGDGDLIEVVDGGVGDDPGETIRADDAPASDEPAEADSLPPQWDPGLPPSHPLPVLSRADRPPRRFDDAPSRCARLQRFRF